MPEPIVFEDTIGYLLAKVTTAYRNALERHMGAIGLHSGQAFILLELWDQDGLRQIDLARRLSVKPPTVSNMLKGLGQINLIKTEQFDDDARSTRVFLTEKGKVIRSEVEKQWVELEAECVSGLTNTERLVFADVLRKLRARYTGQKLVDEE